MTLKSHTCKRVLHRGTLISLYLVYLLFLLFMEQCKKSTKSEEIKKRISTFPCQCFDLLAIARSVQEGNEQPGSKSLESASIGGRIGLILFSIFVWSSCGKWKRELPFTQHQSLSYAIFTLILPGRWDDYLHFTEIVEIVKKQGWKSQDFNLGLNPIYACALRILF